MNRHEMIAKLHKKAYAVTPTYCQTELQIALNIIKEMDEENQWFHRQLEEILYIRPEDDKYE